VAYWGGSDEDSRGSFKGSGRPKCTQGGKRSNNKEIVLSRRKTRPRKNNVIKRGGERRRKTAKCQTEEVVSGKGEKERGAYKRGRAPCHQTRKQGENLYAIIRIQRSIHKWGKQVLHKEITSEPIIWSATRGS